MSSFNGLHVKSKFLAVTNHRLIVSLLILGATSVFTSSTALAATITLTASRDGYTGYSLSTGDVAGSGVMPTLLVGRTGTNFGIGLYFDVSAIPAGSTINSAVVKVFQTAGNTSLGINLSTVASGSWTEAALSSQGWSTLVASSAIDLGTVGSTTLNAYNDVGNAALAAQVSNWVNAPASNLGLLLNQSAYPGGTNKTFAARFSDGGDAAREPLLTITYTPVPEPASLGLLGLAGMMLLSRRSRNGVGQTLTHPRHMTDGRALY